MLAGPVRRSAYSSAIRALAPLACRSASDALVRSQLFYHLFSHFAGNQSWQQNSPCLFPVRESGRTFVLALNRRKQLQTKF